jgi:hypothetical protein
MPQALPTSVMIQLMLFRTSILTDQASWNNMNVRTLNNRGQTSLLSIRIHQDGISIRFSASKDDEKPE